MKYILMVLLLGVGVFTISGCALFEEQLEEMKILQSESEDCTVRPLTETCASLETDKHEVVGEFIVGENI